MYALEDQLKKSTSNEVGTLKGIDWASMVRENQPHYRFEHNIGEQNF